MLHMAIMHYKNDYGSFPPSYDSNPDANLVSSNTSPTAFSQKHLLRLFPRTSQTNAASASGQFQNFPPVLTPVNATLSWLRGYTSDRTSPLLGGDRRKLFDYDSSRTDTAGIIYFPAKKPGAPYIYLSSADYSKFDKITGTVGTGWPSSAYAYTVGNASYSVSNLAANRYFPHRVPAAGSTDWTTTTQPYFNEATFQILCAGLDETFGTDDDLSNFWKGTRQDYLDSLD